MAFFGATGVCFGGVCRFEGDAYRSGGSVLRFERVFAARRQVFDRFARDVSRYARVSCRFEAHVGECFCFDCFCFDRSYISSCLRLVLNDYKIGRCG